jgi:hypothetical protein
MMWARAVKLVAVAAAASAALMGAKASCGAPVAVAGAGSGTIVLEWQPATHSWKQISIAGAAGAAGALAVSRDIRAQTEGRHGTVTVTLPSGIYPSDPCNEGYNQRSRSSNFIIATWLPPKGDPELDKLTLDCLNYRRIRHTGDKSRGGLHTFANVINCISSVIANGMPGRNLSRYWGDGKAYVIANDEGRIISAVAGSEDRWADCAQKP